MPNLDIKLVERRSLRAKAKKTGWGVSTTMEREENLPRSYAY